MNAKSVFSRDLDPYRAGLELGRGIAPTAPEAVLLFSSIHYRGSYEILEGLHDGLGRKDVAVVGATGDGWYEGGAVADVGASAVGLSTGGRVRFRVARAAGVTSDTEKTVHRCLDDLERKCGDDRPALLFVLADFHADATRLVAALNRRVAVPVVGGLAGDEYRMERCYEYAGRDVLTDSVVALAMCGDIRYEILLAGHLDPVGRPGRVTRARGTDLVEIDDVPAMTFIERETGKPASAADIGIGAFSVVDPQEPSQKCLRSIARIDAADGTVTLFGGIEEGLEVRFCQTYAGTLASEVREVAERAGRLGFDPAAGILVSCAGRKRVTGDRADDYEVRLIREGIGRPLPLAGFPSFGEIGPRRAGDRYTASLFHNVTYILLLLGD